MLILSILQGNLGLFLEGCELVGVLEHKMHESLHIDLYLDLVLLFQVLILTLLVAQFGLLIL